MDIGLITMWAVTVLAIVLACVALFKAAKSPNVNGVFEELVSSTTGIEQAAASAREYVLAAQQLWESGRIPRIGSGDVDPRFEWVFERLQRYFPELSEDELEASIEASVRWMKMGAQRVGV